MSTVGMIATWCAVHVRFRVRSERGASLIEYALLIALIALVCLAAVTLLGGETSSKFSSVSGSVSAAGNG